MADGADRGDQGNKRRFAAFISYAHADAAIAAKLQARLERYRLPKHLAQSHTGGEAALGQIFRDREDLAAAPSLSDAIRAAIEEAEALIVICSPDAAASRWVGEEIALFRSLHPDRPILAAVVRGDPGEAFPAALTEDGTEPLAADLRKEADGEALGFLKIVAGIAGVPLDALVQRDAQRRIRRVMWITGGAIAAMLIMGVMTSLALQARNEAARQRAEAEGLVEYMLTDLREVLRGVGRPEAMVSVNERALKYYQDEGGLEDLPADSLSRRARVLLAMGEDDERYGRIEKAISKFREAHRTTAALLAQSNRNPDRIFAHAQSEYWVGFSARVNGDSRSAKRHWIGYLQQANALASVEPKSIRSLMEQAYAYGNLCDLNLEANRNLNASLEQCTAAIEYAQLALKESVNDKKIQQDLANRFGWLARVHHAKGNFKSAITARTAEAKILDSLLKADKQNVEFAIRHIWADIGIAQASLRIANGKGASDALRQSPVATLQKLEPDAKDLRITETLFRWHLWSSFVVEDRRIHQQKSREYFDKIVAIKSGERDRIQKLWAQIEQEAGGNYDRKIKY